MRHKSRWWIMAGFSRARTAALLILLYLVVQTSDASYTSEKEDPMPHTKVEQWATKMGYYIYALANEVSKYSEISNEFQKEGASITTTDGLKMVKEMAGDVTNMLNFKIEAVKRIMNVAEEASLDPDYRKDTPFEYYNAKKLNSYYVSDKHEKNGQLKEGFREILLYNNSHFDSIPVNLSASSVHVPTNVYDGAPDVIQAIRWSEALDRTFISNYGLDPTLSWQYFASSTGFLRQYPAAKWVQDDRDPDLYDARLRSWYIQAANSPKDMVILLDVSGSMTGLRREIAKHVVLNILDTLNENDFVNVFNFSKDTTALVPCFNDTLVQATLENVGEFKSALSNITTKDIANFTQALTKAFKLLEKYRESGHGSQCNQAIMLVSDGAPYKYVELFRKHNMPQFQVRIFTYLIGREVTDKDALKWMACANKGYFVHVTTLAEVREQVLKYIPVIARPMIMYQNNHPEIWTGVYADIAGRRESPGSYEGYRLMTTVAVPVFDRNTYEERVANLLGVAGTDVPIREIEKLIPPYKLGVNGYRFMVNKNGHILFHPDLRPVFQDILKPNYNSVDLNEVELIDDIEDPRFNHSVLLELRTDMIDQRTSELELNVRIHMDNMKRVVTREQTYFTKAVGDTPFSLGIAMPKGYGKYRVVGQIEISREMRETTGLNASDFFTSGNWRLHPDWVYCEYKYDQYDLQGSRPTIEQEMMNFIVRAQSPGWKWRSSRTRPPPERNMKTAQCDKELVQSLLFDAKVTNVYDIKPKIEKDTLNRGRHKSSGVTTAFVATRSGLTRWVDFVPHNEDEPHFMETNNRAIDEVWYRRAVDYYEQDNASFIYSVPFDAATRDPDKVIVTATRAIFVATNAQQKAPAAVVGINIKHDKFVEFFRNHTYTCPSYAARDTCIRSKTCKNEFLDCYLLDDNGYVVVSEKFTDTGKFFGEIEGTIMESLVQSELYKRVKVYDYQAVCLQPKKKGSGASSLPTPMQALQWTANWIMGKIFWVLLKTNLYFLWDANSAWAFTQRSVDQSIPDIEPPIPDIPDYKDTPFEEINATILEEDYATESLPPEYGADYTVLESGNDSYSYYDAAPKEEPSIVEVDDEEYEELIASDYFEPTDEDYMHQPVDGGEFPSLQMAYINKTRPKRCDKEVDLYMLQTAKLLDTKGNYRAVKGKLSNCHANGCARPFSVQKVQNTNLILIAVDNLCPCPSSKVDVNPREVEYNETQHCERLLTNNFRRRPKYCCNYHSEEDQIKDCGGCGGLTFQPLLLLALLVVEYSLNHLRLRS